MSTAARKSKGVTEAAPADGAALPIPMSPAVLKNLVVEQATYLGDGYVVMKLDAPRGSRRPRDVFVPAIPRDHLRKLLERVVDEHGAGSAGASGEIPNQWMPPVEDNRRFLGEMGTRAMERRQRLYDEGLLLTSAQLCERLGISRQALSKAVKGQRMFWIEGPSGVQWYPAFFASASARRRDLERVSVALGELPGAVKWQFFTTPKYSLEGKTPVEVLENGGSERVLRAATEFVERSLGR